MTDTAKRLAGPSVVTATAADLYVCGVVSTVVRNIHVANTTAGDVTVSISIGTTGIDTAASRFYDAVIVPAHGALDWSGFLVLATNDRLVAKASAATSLTITVSGVEVS